MTHIVSPPFFHLKHLFLGSLLFATCSLISPPAFAQKMTPCQNPKDLQIESWNYELVYELDKPIWSSEKSAQELNTMQTQYYAQKTSPFMKNVMPSSLGFYLSNLKVVVHPKITYSITLEKKSCATVTGAKVVIKASPLIYLAQELTAQQCVSSEALRHQLKIQEILEQVLKEAVSKPELFKEDTFAVYQKNGVSGITQEDIIKGLEFQQNQVQTIIFKKIVPYFKTIRRSKVDNSKEIEKLYGLCDGLFGKTVFLAKK